MDVIVLIKEVPDLNVYVEVEPKTLKVDPDDIMHIPNPCDLISLRLAVTFIQELGDGCVTSLLLGPKQAKRTLRKCLDYGADRAIHLLYENINELENHQIAFIIKEAISIMNLPYDLIFTGCSYAGGSFANGSIGTQVGTYLGLLQVSQVVRIKPRQGHNDLIFECALDFGDQVTIKCCPPLLLTIHSDAEQIVYPSFARSLEALNIRVKSVDLTDLHLDPLKIEKRTSLLSCCAPRPRPKKVFTPKNSLSAAEKIRLIMSGGLEKKKSDFLEGSPEELAKYITDFLVQKGMLDQKLVR